MPSASTGPAAMLPAPMAAGILFTYRPKDASQRGAGAQGELAATLRPFEMLAFASSHGALNSRSGQSARPSMA